MAVGSGKAGGFSAKLRARLLSATLTLRELDEMVAGFESARVGNAVRAGDAARAGNADVDADRSLRADDYPRYAYAASKTFETMLSRVLAATTASHIDDIDGPDSNSVGKSRQAQPVEVTACCPGLCRTGLGGRSISFFFAKWLFGVSAFEGADTPAWLAVCSSEEFAGCLGRLVRNRASVQF
jgi:hypothetical protein